MKIRATDPALMAQQFWLEVGGRDKFPRDIERAVALVVPVSIVKLSALTVPLVAEWLAERGLTVRVPADGRDLMGCVVAHRGHALIFVCGADPDDDQRLTIAHEIAHVLRHYLGPRQAVLDAVGSTVLPVLDGDRRPTVRERAAAVLAGVRLGPHVHLLERPSGDTSRHPGSDRHVERVEEQADDLGLELVAPRAEVVRVLGSLVARDIARENRCASLATYFGVPASCFADVVRAAEVRPPTSFISQVVAHLRTVNHGKPV